LDSQACTGPGDELALATFSGPVFGGGVPVVLAGWPGAVDGGCGCSLMPLDGVVALASGTFVVLMIFPSSVHVCTPSFMLQLPEFTYCSVKGAAACCGGGVAVVGGDAVGVVVAGWVGGMCCGGVTVAGDDAAGVVAASWFGGICCVGAAGFVIARGVKEVPELVPELVAESVPELVAKLG
jgi:hypothetical protein